MRVVLDSNVLVAAFATHGLCADVFEHCLYQQTIVISDYLLTEVQRNLCKKIKLPPAKADTVRKFLAGIAEIVKPAKLPKDACRDPRDVKVLGTAVAGKAKVIVSGDQDLLILKKFKTIQILTPRGFWEYVQQP